MRTMGNSRDIRHFISLPLPICPTDAKTQKFPFPDVKINMKKDFHKHKRDGEGKIGQLFSGYDRSFRCNPKKKIVLESSSVFRMNDTAEHGGNAQ